MFAILETGGKQYKVKEGDVIRVEKLNADVADDIVFDQLLAVFEAGKLNAGRPYVEGARAVGSVIEHGKADKVMVFKFKKRNKYRRLRGHRQEYTQVRIDSIEV